MYDLKIFNDLESLGKFIVKKNITDYSFTRYEFNFRNEIKTNYFLSFKIN